jgi:hypothetical protein
VTGGKSFDEQVRGLRDRLRDQEAALGYVVEVNRRVESRPAYASSREQGGMVLEHLDPTRVVVPIVWLRCLLSDERSEGYAVVAESQEMRALLREWGAASADASTLAALALASPELVEALSSFVETL